jgi:hypothetical protein
MKQPLRKVIMLMALAAAGQALAQELASGQAQIKDKNAVNPQAITMLAPQRCFSSGSGTTFLKICITDNGNISWFEAPGGKVHLQNREGYAVCSGGIPGNGAIVHGFDANIAANGWGNPAISQPNGAGTFPLIITRQSLDGVIELKQTFTRNTAERGIDVKLDVKNITAMYLYHVFLSRYFDADADGTITNLYDRSHESVWATNPLWSSRRGLALMLAPSDSLQYWNTSGTAYAQWDPFGSGQQYAKGCDWANSYSPASGDFVGIVQVKMASQLDPGQTKTVMLRYRPL